MKIRIIAALLCAHVASLCVAACGSKVTTSTGSGGTGTGGGGAPECLGQGEDCTSDAECCGICDGQCWTENDPLCREPGAPCSSDFDCCFEVCNDGTCASYDCDCACGPGTNAALVCDDPNHPSFCAGVPPIPGGPCEQVLIQECGFTYDDIASLSCN